MIGDRARLGAGCVAFALCALASLAVRSAVPFVSSIPTLLALGLVAAVVLSYRFPVQVGLHARMELNSVPLFILACGLGPGPAAALAGLGILGAELGAYRKRQSWPETVASAVGRWTLVIFLASLVAHHVPGLGGLLAAATVQLSADFLTAPLAIAPIARMHPLAILRELVRSALPLEAMQYALAIPTYVAVTVAAWAPTLLIPALVALHHLCKRASELHEHSKLMLEHLAVAVDARDTYTGCHSRRVADLTAAILRAMTIVGPEAELIVAAARVHDIGKVDLPDSILRKPGPLNAEERALIETHALRGAALVRSALGFGRLAPLVAAHHESYDGTGYPRGLAGERIPFGARVIAVADSFDAMTSDRPYRRGTSRVAALATLHSGRGGQWDPAVVDALADALPHLVDTTSEEPAPVVGTIAG